MDTTDLLANIVKTEDGVLKLNDQFLYDEGMPPHHHGNTTLESINDLDDIENYMDRTLDGDDSGLSIMCHWLGAYACEIETQMTVTAHTSRNHNHRRCAILVSSAIFPI